MTLRADTRSFLRGPLIRSPTRRWYGVLVDDAGAVVWRSPNSYRTHGQNKGSDRALKVALAELERRTKPCS